MGLDSLADYQDGLVHTLHRRHTCFGVVDAGLAMAPAPIMMLVPVGLASIKGQAGTAAIMMLVPASLAKAADGPRNTH